MVVFKCGALSPVMQEVFDTPLFPDAEGNLCVPEHVLAGKMEGCVLWDIRPGHVAAPDAKREQSRRSDTEDSLTAAFLARCCLVAREVQQKGGQTPRGAEGLQSHLGFGSPSGSSSPAKDFDAIVQTVRKAVLLDVERRMSEESARLMSRGNHLFSQMQARQKETLDRLTLEVAACTVRQRALQGENSRLREELRSLSATPDPLSDRPSPPSVQSSVPVPDCPTSSEGASKENPCLPFSDVPPFPFLPSVSTVPTAPLSLAEALATEATSRGPLSSDRCLETSRARKSEAGDQSNERSTFHFTLRKADSAELGLNLSHREDDGVLCVEGVRPGGAIDAWNKQCAGSVTSQKAIIKGDCILSVNNVTDPVKMLDECRSRLLLKFTVQRRNAASSLPAVEGSQTGQTSKSVLRADATEFVPGIWPRVPPLVATG